MIHTFVGSGGKTTAIFKLAEELRRAGKSVLITTTTHMLTPAAYQESLRLNSPENQLLLLLYKEEWFCASDDPVEICRRLDRDGICIAGVFAAPKGTNCELPVSLKGNARESFASSMTEKKADQPAGLTKFTPLSEDTFRRVSCYADETLVEGDGSKCLPLKFPNATEPVIPEDTDRITVLCGMISLGKPFHTVTHRFELGLTALNATGFPCNKNTLVTEELIERLYEEGYLKPLKERYPKAVIEFRKVGNALLQVSQARLEYMMDHGDISL